MNRRSIIGAMAAASLPVLAHAQTPEPHRCVLMEEREGAFVLEGTGNMLSEPFHLDEGTYRIEVEIPEPRPRSWGINLQFFIRADGSKSGAFHLSDSNEIPGFGSGAITARETGEFVVETSSYGRPWKIVLSPI